MGLRALKFTASPQGGKFLQITLEPESVPSLAETRPQQNATAYLLRNQDLASLRQFKDLVVDRGKKHKAKSLSDLLLGQEKIPLIAGSYTVTGQLIRSLRNLLVHAWKRDDRNIYLIGADEVIFRELWERAATQPDAIRTGQSPALPIARLGSSRALLDLLPPYDVPPDLVRRYIGESPETRLVRQLILRAAQREEPVLILGDTGTGKEVVARSIHEYSVRRLERFTSVNCGAIPRELFESELFGHEKGSFTSAFNQKAGLWKVADKGTLFLDEIGDLALDLQVKILRALQEGTIRPVGAVQEIPVKARVVAASNRDLFSMVQTGQFREDLYYRLRAFLIRTPPLREHPEDIPLLAQSFWKEIVHDQECSLPEKILVELQAYRWPGNARELKAVLMNIHNLFGRDGINVEHLRAVFELQGQGVTPREGPAVELEIDLHRVECLRHLRRVADALRACEVSLQPILQSRRFDVQTVSAVEAAIQRRLSELNLLCLHPLMFQTEETFAVVLRLKEKLSELHTLVQAGGKDARRYWNSELANECKQTLTAIFGEVERLLKKT